MAIYREIYIVRIASNPVALFHSGYGKLLVPADSVIGPSAAIALGGGELVNIPDYQQLINGTAERLDFEVSGVDATTIAFAIEEAASVRGARVDLGLMDCDENWVQIAPVEWEATFEARSLTVSRAVATGTTNPTRSISLSVASGDTTRARAHLAFFTDSDQRRRSPTDSIFDHVAGINAGVSRRFGPSDA